MCTVLLQPEDLTVNDPSPLSIGTGVLGAALPYQQLSETYAPVFDASATANAIDFVTSWPPPYERWPPERFR
jgi:hypothetical protein